MKRELARCALCVILCLISAQGSAQASPVSATTAPRLAQRLSDARGVDYAAEVAPGLWRGSQPSTGTIAWLKQRGIRTVINLRQFRFREERELVTAAGMQYEHIPLDASDAPSEENVRRFLSLVTDPARRPIYVHCAHGVDRTGAMVAVYRMEIEGWSNAAAYEEMKVFGAHRLWWDLRRFVRHYRRGSLQSRRLAQDH